MLEVVELGNCQAAGRSRSGTKAGHYMKLDRHNVRAVVGRNEAGMKLPGRARRLMMGRPVVVEEQDRNEQSES
jgi:hypothetical protein